MKKNDQCPDPKCYGTIVQTKAGKLYCYVCGRSEGQAAQAELAAPEPEVKRANIFANEDFYDPDWRA